LTTRKKIAAATVRKVETTASERAVRNSDRDRELQGRRKSACRDHRDQRRDESATSEDRPRPNAAPITTATARSTDVGRDDEIEELLACLDVRRSRGVACPVRSPGVGGGFSCVAAGCPCETPRPTAEIVGRNCRRGGTWPSDGFLSGTTRSVRLNWLGSRASGSSPRHWRLGRAVRFAETRTRTSEKRQGLNGHHDARGDRHRRLVAHQLRPGIATSTTSARFPLTRPPPRGDSALPPSGARQPTATSATSISHRGGVGPHRRQEQVNRPVLQQAYLRVHSAPECRLSARFGRGTGVRGHRGQGRRLPRRSGGPSFPRSTRDGQEPVALGDPAVRAARPP